MFKLFMRSLLSTDYGLIPHLDKLVQEGLMAVSRVEVIRYTRAPATTPQ